MPLGANKAAIMGVAGVSTADVVLLSSQTASGSSELDFTDLMTSTYGEYIFRFYNINPANDGVDFKWQVNATDDDGGDYDQSEITSTYFDAQHSEDDNTTALGYREDFDQANGAAFQWIDQGTGNGADESSVGELHIFNPASTTYVKHFYSRAHHVRSDNRANSYFIGGYINDTTAIDDIRFKMSAGNFDGKIKMWGVK